jgi:hypothetical protein
MMSERDYAVTYHKENPMKFHHGFEACVAAAVLAGCGAAQTATGVLPQAASSQPTDRAGEPACTPAGADGASCLAVIVNDRVQYAVSGWAPADFQTRYKLPSGTKGAGQIVAIVDAYDNPNAASDLAAYRSEFGLGAPTFYKYNQDGQQGNYPSGSVGWGVETDLDAEMVSATCPLCTIYLVEANSSDTSDLQTATAEAVKLGAHIVDDGWGCDASSCVSQRYFDHKGVTYVAADGDGGYPDLYPPAAFASVAAIGGTVLSKSGSQYSETIWDDSAGGCATDVKKPKWQHDTVCTYRLGNDAAAVAWDVAAYDSYGYSGWFTVGGTSVSSALMAGMFGLAGNATHQDGGRTFWQSRHHKDLYKIGGTCSGYGKGRYTSCAGWGSPDGLGAL